MIDLIGPRTIDFQQLKQARNCCTYPAQTTNSSKTCDKNPTVVT